MPGWACSEACDLESGSTTHLSLVHCFLYIQGCVDPFLVLMGRVLLSYPLERRRV
jgi:hypothetical protein